MRNVIRAILLLSLFSFSGCEDQSTPTGSSGSAAISYPDFDQIQAVAVASPNHTKRTYSVEIRNRGEEAIVALKQVGRRWRSNQSIDRAWNQETVFGDNIGAGIIHIKPGDTATIEASPRTFDNVELQFSVVLIGKKGEAFPRLLVWTKSVSPGSERWINQAEQGGAGQPR